ncbi:hypothetical protein ACYT69_10615, partial [Streptococcus pyogenes]
VRHDKAGITPALFQNQLPVDSSYRTVFETIYQQAAPWTLDRVAAETEIPAHTILRLARDYGTTAPAMIVQNMSGAQRTEFGTYVAASQF